jgi:hypothetical protein
VTNVSPTSVPRSGASAAATALHLSGRWLALAHIGWIGSVLLGATILVGGVPAYYGYAQTPCTAPNQAVCVTFVPDVFRAVAHVGFSPVGVSALVLGLQGGTSLIFLACGALIAQKCQEAVARRMWPRPVAM